MFIESGVTGAGKLYRKGMPGPAETPFQLFYGKDMKRRCLGKEEDEPFWFLSVRSGRALPPEAIASGDRSFLVENLPDISGENFASKWFFEKSHSVCQKSRSNDTIVWISRHVQHLHLGKEVR